MALLLIEEEKVEGGVYFYATIVGDRWRFGG